MHSSKMCTTCLLTICVVATMRCQWQGWLDPPHYLDISTPTQPLDIPTLPPRRDLEPDIPIPKRDLGPEISPGKGMEPGICQGVDYQLNSFIWPISSRIQSN